MKKMHLFGTALAAALLVASVGGSAMAGNGTFVPKGHSYSPGNERLPRTNSQKARISNQADIYESEIYRINRERAILDAEMRRMIELDLTGGTDFEPRY